MDNVPSPGEGRIHRDEKRRDICTTRDRLPNYTCPALSELRKRITIEFRWMHKRPDLPRAFLNHTGLSLEPIGRPSRTRHIVKPAISSCRSPAGCPRVRRTLTYSNAPARSKDRTHQMPTFRLRQKSGHQLPRAEQASRVRLATRPSYFLFTADYRELF